MKIYTKTGDKGETSLLGGKRVKKNCIEIDAIGEVDELNAFIGILIASLPIGFENVSNNLSQIQHRLFVVGSNIASVQMQLDTIPKLHDSDVEFLENWIDEMEKDLKPLAQFILPSGQVAAVNSFFARAICRRAERRVVDGQIQVTFPRNPSESTRDKIKGPGIALKWSNYSKKWVRKHTATTGTKWFKHLLAEALTSATYE
jgi:cob(I)alamin adenosyltransferase